MDRRTDTVRRFYERTPFPGYPPHDSLHALRARAGRSRFARLLDRSIAGDARIVDAGCGTGQMCLYLARADRSVIGVDLARPSLELAAHAATRFGLKQVHFVESDLRQPPLRPASFDVVYSSGALHHTPEPRAAFASIVKLAKTGGIVVIGVYNVLARLPSRARRVIAHATGFRLIPFDPVLRDREDQADRREAWLRDQYDHPEEHRHTLGEVQRWFAENDVEYLRAYPSALFDTGSDDLFAPAADNWRPEGWLAQLGWMWTLGREGGLFFTIGRKG